jgi:hypothetical protein
MYAMTISEETTSCLPGSTEPLLNRWMPIAVELAIGKGTTLRMLRFRMESDIQL